MSKDEGRNQKSATAPPEAPAQDAAAEQRGAAGPEAQEPLPPPPPEPLSAEDEAEREQQKREYLVQRFRHSARGFWGRAGDSLAWPLTLGVLALILIDVAFKYGIN